MSLVEIREGRNLFIEEFDFIDNNEEDKITLFFYHGSMATYLQFNQLINYFKRKYRVIAYDVYGCGQSDKPIDPWTGEEQCPYSTQNLLLDAIAIFERYASTRNILLGHSFGSTIVGRIVHSYEVNGYPSHKAINGVVLLGTADEMKSGGNPIFLLPLWLLHILHPYLSHGFADRAFSPTVDPIIKQQALSQSGKNTMHVVQSFYRNYHWADETIWTSISSKPVLILQGEDDQLTLLRKAEALYTKYIQGDNDLSKLVVIPKAGHQLMQERPTEVIAEIELFINSIFNK